MSWLRSLFGIRTSAEKDAEVLAYLKQNPLSLGQDIRVACGLSRGTVYVRLNRLEADGLIASYPEYQVRPWPERPRLLAGQPSRRVYELAGGRRKEEDEEDDLSNVVPLPFCAAKFDGLARRRTV